MCKGFLNEFDRKIETFWSDTLWKIWKFTLTYFGKFYEINVLLLDFQVRVNFCFFHTVSPITHFSLTLFWQKFCQSNIFTKEVYFTKIGTCILWGKNLSTFSLCQTQSISWWKIYQIDILKKIWDFILYIINVVGEIVFFLEKLSLFWDIYRYIFWPKFPFS